MLIIASLFWKPSAASLLHIRRSSPACEIKLEQVRIPISQGNYVLETETSSSNKHLFNKLIIPGAEMYRCLQRLLKRCHVYAEMSRSPTGWLEEGFVGKLTFDWCFRLMHLLSKLTRRFPVRKEQPCRTHCKRDLSLGLPQCSVGEIDRQAPGISHSALQER